MLARDGETIMEWPSFVNFSVLLFITLYVYCRILNIEEISKLKIAAAVLFSLGMGAVLSFEPFLYELIFLGSVLAFVAVAARRKAALMVSAVIISTGISLAIDFAMLTLLLFVDFVVAFFYGLSIGLSGEIPTEAAIAEHINQLTDPLLVESIMAALSLLFTFFLFTRKRVKNGFAFLESTGARRVGVVFSVAIMVIRSFMGNLTLITDSLVEQGTFILIFLLLTNICTIGFHLWWRYQTSAQYQSEQLERVINQQDELIQAKDSQIVELVESNDFLAAAIHRDNKLIPAMYAAVSSLLEAGGGEVDVALKPRLLATQADLEEMMRERRSLLQRVQVQHRDLPATGIGRLDNMLDYMHSRARDKGIDFGLAVLGGGEANGAVGGGLAAASDALAIGDVAIQDLVTLLADLLDNAIIAVEASPDKRIQVQLDNNSGYLSVTVSDSGVPFESATLAGLGLGRTSSHEQDGGSGIGYQTIFGILGRYAASWCLTELPPEAGGFTKSVQVRFDQGLSLCIKSPRAEELSRTLDRPDIVII